MEQFLEKLKNPSTEYRPVPFWSWNDKLDKEMLRWQIREMKKAGLGGYFMHARGGLKTEYLSKEWMDCIEACIEEGKKEGMHSWCYDEEGWPSGFAGGIVTALGHRCHVKWLELITDVGDDALKDKKVVGVYQKNEQGNYTLIESGSGGDEQVVVIQNSNPYYIDILDQAVVREFIDSTYEKYYEQFGKEFGSGMMGFFTDEPQYSRRKMPWSDILADRFLKKYHYDLTAHLPKLYLEYEGYEQFRYDYWTLVSELYVSSFGEQIYKWCEEHNCLFTGHAMDEDTLYAQMAATAGVMPFYEFMHYPGIDWLRRCISSPMTPKQVGSVAAQLGKKFVLSEMFALCGWDVSFEELKWIAEWQYVNGVSLMCQHLQSYSLHGLRKRDYPPSLFYHQPWWEEYKQFNDYFARLGMLLTSGDITVDVLLLHPIRSAYLEYNGSNSEGMQRLNNEFVNATETLAGIHIDHHYGDEEILRKHGSVSNGRFNVGLCAYKVVVLPTMRAIDINTVRLLNEFIADGGSVVAMGEFPAFCGGGYFEELEELRKKVLFAGSSEDILELTRQLGIKRISVCDDLGEVGKIHYMQREIDGKSVFFLVNHDKENEFDTTVTISGVGSAKLLSLEKEQLVDVNYTSSGEDTTLRLKFLPMQSHILVFDHTDVKTTAAESSDTAVVIKPNHGWNIEAIDLNSLTLDYCSYSIDGGEWVGPIPVIRLMSILLEYKRTCDIALKFNFEMEMGPEKCRELFLVVEEAAEFEIFINSDRVIYQDIGCWKDSSFNKVDVAKFVQKGSNEIILKRKFFQRQKVYDVLFGKNVLETERNKLTYDTELESIYLVGDFGVKSLSAYTYGERKAIFTEGPFVITERPGAIGGNDLTVEGFCFFSGSVKLSQEITVSRNKDARVLLDLGRPNAVISKIYVNDVLAGTLPWAPYAVDITDFIKEGTNKVTVELFSGNRNLLGPHHHADGEVHSVGPSSFTDKAGMAEFWVDRYIWNDRYCFVKFGLDIE